jgi:hypothetical protein
MGDLLLVDRSRRYEGRDAAASTRALKFASARSVLALMRAKAGGFTIGTWGTEMDVDD